MAVDFWMAPPRRNTKTSSASPPPSESPKAVDDMSTKVKELFEEQVDLIKPHFSEEIAKQTASHKANFRELKYGVRGVSNEKKV